MYNMYNILAYRRLFRQKNNQFSLLISIDLIYLVYSVYSVYLVYLNFILICVYYWYKDLSVINITINQKSFNIQKLCQINRTDQIDQINQTDQTEKLKIKKCMIIQ